MWPIKEKELTAAYVVAKSYSLQPAVGMCRYGSLLLPSSPLAIRFFFRRGILEKSFNRSLSCDQASKEAKSLHGG